MLIGLDLFSGIGGLSLALSQYVRPAAYCENDRYAQGVLLSRMGSGDLPCAPIWDDVRTLRASRARSEGLPAIDIVYGGFPCQDISCAGLGKGLEGERSGLVFEVFRLVSEFKPTFVFLENVPAVRSRGAERISKELARRGYDLRWGSLSAAEVGAPHRRNRWFLLAYAGSERRESYLQRDGDQITGSEVQFRHDVDGLRSDVPDADRTRLEGSVDPFSGKGTPDLARQSSDETCERDATDSQREPLRDFKQREPEGRPDGVCDEGEAFALDSDWWTAEPSVGRMADGIPDRAHRLRALGNAVVPLQAKVAFEKLVGIRR